MTVLGWHSAGAYKKVLEKSGSQESSKIRNNDGSAELSSEALI
ncbi:MAG: hypothetical protein ACI9SP_003752 [Arenicella sp.]|jgi:hypothetical protein